MKYSLSGLLVVILFVSAFSGGEAMFGLEWGVSPTKLKEMGISLEKKKVENNLHAYTCASLPKNLSISESYSLMFDEDTALVKISMISTTIENDPYGSKGKELFDNLVNLLKKKYKIDVAYCYTGRKLYNESDEFYECLRYEGCGNWITFFKADNISIAIELKGLGRGEGFIGITVESEPEFLKAIKKSDEKTDSKDSDAF